MSVHPLAGQKAPYEILINVPRLISAYYTHRPDPGIPATGWLSAHPDIAAHP